MLPVSSDGLVLSAAQIATALLHVDAMPVVLAVPAADCQNGGFRHKTQAVLHAFVLQPWISSQI